MVRKLAINSEKGGTGKSTLAINLSVCLARAKRPTLLIDADAQCNASLVMLKGERAEPPSLAHVLMNQADAADCIRKTGIPGLDILPGSPELAEANLSLAVEIGRERRLRQAMQAGWTTVTTSL